MTNAVIAGLALFTFAGTLRSVTPMTPQPAPPAPPAAGRAVELTGTARVNGKPARDAVIWLAGGRKSVPLKKAVVDQRDKTFIPHVTVVTVGTEVEFPNNDRVFHNVFAWFHAKKFDLGMYPRGATKTVKFDKPGLVALLCNVHSEMSAYVMVVDSPYFAVTDRNGRFRIKDAAAGAYTLHGWHESGAVAEQALTVDGDAKEIEVTLRRK